MSLSAILFVFGVLLGATLAFVRHPVFGLVTYVIAYFVSPQSRWWGHGLPTDRWSLITSGILLLAVLLRRQTHDRISTLGCPPIWGLLTFLAWISVQSLWALEPDRQMELIEQFVKYTVLFALIYVCMETPRQLRLFLWAQVIGGCYLGWAIYAEYVGGRFEGTGVPNANDANSGALMLVCISVAAAVMFLAGRWRSRIALLGAIPFLLNALVTTISRTGFVALAAAGLVFNFLSPRRYRRVIRLLSVLAIVLFVLLTNPLYWSRIETIKYAGEEVSGVDTAHSRLVLMGAQWKMFKLYPFGCGHRCTATLSPRFLEERYLTGPGGSQARSSHNTFMTLLVEQGIPGATLYVLLMWWSARASIEVWQKYRDQDGFLSQLLPGVAAVLAACAIGDLFVDFLKFEIRFWYLAVLMVLLTNSKQSKSELVASDDSNASGQLRQRVTNR